VLLSAYACEPDRGSEPGSGWNWARAAARDHDVWVLTRANNRPAIERALERAPVPSLRFVYLDLPAWARSWKRHGRGVRLYYVLWQLRAATAARRLHREHRFDVVHHLTFANMWLPALVWAAPAPFVLGPIAGGQRVPWRLYGTLGVRGAATELLLLGLRPLSRVNPLVRFGWRRASVILVTNEETRRALPTSHRGRCLVRTNASIDVPLPSPPRQDSGAPVAFYGGRLTRFKGVSVAIGAVRLLPAWRFVVAGDGPDRRRLERLALEEGLDGRVTFCGQLSQERLWRELAAARALVLPSLKEGASFVAAEAQAHGVPVVAFDRGGPAALAKLPGASVALVPPERLATSARCFAAALEGFEERSPMKQRPDFGLHSVARDVSLAYERATAAPRHLRGRRS
jgi:glycosyltransferase involved in cell wall biosynthesis